MKIIRWILLTVFVLILLIVLAGFILPKFIDFNAYKPKIEQAVTEATGRPFSMGDDIELSVFPWLGVRLSDLKMGNPEGFKSAEFISIKHFEARIKLLPLFKKQIEIGKFVVDSPKIYLETAKSGKNNWENLGSTPSTDNKTDSTQEQSKTADKKTADDSNFAISSFKVATFAITNGFVQLTDKKSGEVKTLTDFTLSISNIGQEKPFELDLKGRFNNMPLALSGTVGPTGKFSGTEDMDLDIHLQGLDMLDCHLKGHVTDPSGAASFRGSIDLKSFSPRELMAALGKEFPVLTADQDTFKNLSFASQIVSTPTTVSLSEAKLKLDDSTLALHAQVKDFDHPVITAEITLDQMDVDSYLPPAQTKESQQDNAPAEPAKKTNDPDGNSELQKITLDIQLDAGPLKIANLKLNKTHLTLTGKNGVFRITPLHISLYEGDIDMKALADLRQPTVKNNIELEIQNIQAGPLLRDSANFTKLEGLLRGQIKIAAQGGNADAVLKTAAGQGNLLFTDGAIVGVDLTNIVQDTLGKLNGTQQQAKRKPRTDFSELIVPFSLGQGIATLQNASLVSPLLRLLAEGKANLLDQTLDMRVTPKFVGTFKGQGDKKQRSGAIVPLKITGSFSNPKIRPDMEGAVRDVLSNPDQIKNLLEGKGEKGSGGQDFKNLFKRPRKRDNHPTRKE